MGLSEGVLFDGPRACHLESISPGCRPFPGLFSQVWTPKLQLVGEAQDPTGVARQAVDATILSRERVAHCTGAKRTEWMLVDYSSVVMSCDEDVGLL